MITARFRTTIHAPVSRVFAFHERPDALALLMPPWETAEVVQPPRSLEVGTVVIVKTKIGPVWTRLVARHVAYEKDVMFADLQDEGPFAYWLHRHLFAGAGDVTTLTDEITYELPLGRVGALFAGAFARRKLARMFAYRHEVTKRECEPSAIHSAERDAHVRD